MQYEGYMKFLMDVAGQGCRQKFEREREERRAIALEQ
jgi:hypothetical protein